MTQPVDREQRDQIILRASVRGRVQAVGFRVFVRDAARRLGLEGFVRNRADGSVYVVARGSRPALDALLIYLQRGPELARVTDVESEWAEGTAESEGVVSGRFEVRH